MRKTQIVVGLVIAAALSHSVAEEAPVREFSFVLKICEAPKFKMLFNDQTKERWLDCDIPLPDVSAAARRMVLVNDLVRSSAGYALARAATRILTNSHVVHVDGPRSVESAFTSREALALAKGAGLIDVGVVPKWPCRFLLTWLRQ